MPCKNCTITFTRYTVDCGRILCLFSWCFFFLLICKPFLLNLKINDPSLLHYLLLKASIYICPSHNGGRNSLMFIMTNYLLLAKESLKTSHCDRTSLFLAGSNWPTKCRYNLVFFSSSKNRNHESSFLPIYNTWEINELILLVFIATFPLVLLIYSRRWI